MIELENIHVAYQKDREVLKGVSLRMEAGGFYFLTGASGAGKSTLLRVLGLIQHPNFGVRRAFGEDTATLSRDTLPRLRRRMGLVFQEHHLLDHLTIAQNVALPLKIVGEPTVQINEKVTQMLEWVGLGAHMHDYPSTLSGGQKQRAAIARSVMNNPQLLLADEPTGNLDATLALKIIYLFQTLNKLGATILFATHDESLVSQFDYPVYHLKEGQLSRRYSHAP